MSHGPGFRAEGRIGGQMLALAGLALAGALVSNALAGPTRHLAWCVPPPPAPRPAPGVPPPQTLPAPTTPQPPALPVAPAAPKAGPRPAAPAAPAKPLNLQDRYPAPADGAPFEIGEAEAQALHRGGALFLDARRTAVFEAGHIAGARALPYWEDGLDAKLQALADATFDLKDPVVIYCSGGDCRDSHLLAERMWPFGFRNLRIFKGGWPAWQALKGPSAVGPEVPK
ncbi:MAG TPA: rhodanese-like domain-containing protein [Holophagaceae bacterium]|nr:rhodanese-like domain-containing protein [Holophagaceae bacterium]